MSGPRRSSRHKKKDVQLVVSCLGPKSGAKVDHRTSFYEIDIQSNFDCPVSGAGRRKRKAPAGTAVKVAPKDSRTRTRGKGEDGEAGGPFGGERYAKLDGIIYEEHGSSPSQIASFKLETQLVADNEKDKDRKKYLVNKKRMWTAAESQRKFEKHVKSYVIVGEKRSDVETVVQNYEEDLDGNEVHLHHHEHHHHHHYYANGKTVGSEDGAAPLFFEENFDAAPNVLYPAMTAPNKEGRTTETEESCHLLEAPSPDAAEEASEAPREVSAEDSERLPAQEPPKDPCSDRPSGSPINKTSSKNIQSSLTSVRTPSGADLLFTDGGEEPGAADNLEIHGLRVEKNKSPKTCDSLMESVKNLSHIMSPIVLTDHKTVPKFWYIRCKCGKDGTSPEEVEVRSRRGSREELKRPETVTEVGVAANAAGTGTYRLKPRNARPSFGENSISLPTESEKHEVDPTRELEFEVWLTKLKEELSEIKHQLKRLEAKRLLGNGSATLSFRNEKPTTDSNQITVYSSRTFIVQPPEDAAADL